MKNIKFHLSWKVALIAAWMAATLSLVTWWMIWGLQQSVGESSRYRDMLLGEGIFWIVLLFGGGIALLWLILREERQAKILKDFFSAFSHDLKTSIASLRLQAESLQEDQQQISQNVLDRLVADTVRLELQLENSLALAQEGKANFYLEPISLRKLIDRLILQWPKTKLILTDDCTVSSDEKALTSVLSNLIQNAIVHGKASQITMTPNLLGPSRVEVLVSDNGKGFSGDAEQLGRAYFRHGKKSGSGLGLYIARTLVSQMQGKLSFEVAQGRLVARVELPGEFQ